MAVNYTQYIGGAKVTRATKSGASPSENVFIVHELSTGSFEPTKPNYIDMIKSIGTDSQFTNVDIYDLDGVSIAGALTVEESDRIKGPFGKVTISGSQASGAATSTAPNILIWEKIV